MTRARSLAEALSIVFDAVLSPEGIEKALVLMEDGEDLRGVLGMAWEPREATRFTVSLQDVSHPLVAAYGAGEPRAVTLSGATTPPGRYLAFPIPGSGEVRPYHGLLLVGPEDREVRDLPGIAPHLAA